MGPLKEPLGFVTGMIDPFPAAVQPGLFAAVALLVLWLAARRGRWVWNWGVRTLMVLSGAATGMALYPEYVATTGRRREGMPPSALAIGMTPLFDRVLDGAAAAHESHPRPNSNVLGRPPWGWAFVLCGVSVALNVMLTEGQPQSLVPLADTVFRNWQEFATWAQS